MTEAQNGFDLDNIDALLDASMDDLDDLPPVGVPPTGHYNLTMSMKIEDVKDKEGSGTRKVIFANYIVDAINELKDEADRGDVAVGQQFREGFYLTKKNGEKNTFAIGTLKERLKPLAERFGSTNIGELINQCNAIAITASVKRTQNRLNEDQFNMNLKDIVLL
jgi:hypothetical protein